MITSVKMVSANRCQRIAANAFALSSRKLLHSVTITLATIRAAGHAPASLLNHLAPYTNDCSDTQYRTHPGLRGAISKSENETPKSCNTG